MAMDVAFVDDKWGQEWNEKNRRDEQRGNCTPDAASAAAARAWLASRIGANRLRWASCAGSQGSSTPMKKDPPPSNSTRERKRPGVISEPLPKRSPWYAVSVVIDSEACDAVRALGTTRWLAAYAPRFPILGCDVAYCGCRYRHYNDRRTKAQRYNDRGGMPRQ